MTCSVAFKTVLEDHPFAAQNEKGVLAFYRKSGTNGVLYEQCDYWECEPGLLKLSTALKTRRFEADDVVYPFAFERHA